MATLIQQLTNNASRQFFLLAGPCVIEGEAMALDIAEQALAITQRLGIPYVFKGSYRKANRSRLDSFTGIGDEKALKILRKVRDAGCDDVAITERGTTFGYTDLIVDVRGIPVMRQFAPVIVDVTHSLQQPNQASGVTGGLPQLIEPLARAAIATGADGIFLETHQNPAVAKSDGANMLRLELLDGLLTRLAQLRLAVNELDN